MSETSEKVVLARGDVVALLERLGFKTAGRWNKPKMREMLVNTVAPACKEDGTTVPDAVLQATLEAIVAAGGDVEVVRDKDELREGVQQAVAVAAAEDEARRQDETVVVDQGTEEVEVPKSEKKAGSNPKVKEVKKGSLYWAGVVIKKHLGDGGGVLTPEIFKEVQALSSSKGNTDWAVREAWQAINGFLQG